MARTRFNIEYLLGVKPINSGYDSPKYKIIRSAYDDEGTNVFILLDKELEKIISYSISGTSERNKFKNLTETKMEKKPLKENYLRFFKKFTHLDGQGKKVLKEEIAVGQWVTDGDIDQWILSHGGTDDDIEEWRNLLDYGRPGIDSTDDYIHDANGFLAKYGLQVSNMSDSGDEFEWKISKVNL